MKELVDHYHRLQSELHSQTISPIMIKVQLEAMKRFRPLHSIKDISLRVSVITRTRYFIKSFRKFWLCIRFLVQKHCSSEFYQCPIPILNPQWLHSMITHSKHRLFENYDENKRKNIVTEYENRNFLSDYITFV